MNIVLAERDQLQLEIDQEERETSHKLQEMQDGFADIVCLILLIRIVTPARAAHGPNREFATLQTAS